MNTDIRLSISFINHRKRKKLKRLLGAEGVLALIDLWLQTALNNPDGILRGMDEEDIALEAGWEGDPQEFVEALIKCGFLDQLEDGTYKIHDWEEHQPWAAGAKERSERARRAAKAKWERMNEEEKSEHAKKMAEARWGKEEVSSEDSSKPADTCDMHASSKHNACSMLADACDHACPSPFLSSPLLSSPKENTSQEKKVSTELEFSTTTDNGKITSETGVSPVAEACASPTSQPSVVSKTSSSVSEQSQNFEPSTGKIIPLEAQKQPNASTEKSASSEATGPAKTTGQDANASASGLPPCPHQEIVALYHEILPELPRVVKLTEKRKLHLRTRWREVLTNQEIAGKFGFSVNGKPLGKEAGLAWFRRFFEYIRESDFLMGRVSRNPKHQNWMPRFEWLFKPDNFAKILEGVYHQPSRDSPKDARNLVLSEAGQYTAMAAKMLLEKYRQEEETRRKQDGVDT